MRRWLDAMPSLGDKLRMERESRGIPLDEIAAETRINLRFLEALEKGELSDLPGGAFNKGFVRSYASYLGLEPEPLVREYVEEEHTATEVGRLPQRPDVLDEMREQLGRSDPGAGEVVVRNAVRFGVPIVVLAALAALTWWVVLPALGEWSSRRATEASAGETAMIGAADAHGTEPGGADAGALDAANAAAGDTKTDAGDVAATAADSRAGDTAAQTDDSGTVATDTTAPTSSQAAAPETVTRAPAVGPSTQQPQPATTTASRDAASRAVEPAESDVAPVETTAARDAPPARETPPVTEPAPSPTPVANAPRLDVTESGVGMGIEQRELIGRASRFDEGDTIFFWTRVVGGQPGDEIRHVWLRDGRPVGMIPLSVSGSHWRTHSRFTLPANAGTSRWSVEARAKDGTVLAREEFTVGG